jgi:hypothetical protein
MNTYYILYVYYSPLRRRDGTPQRRGGIASEARKMGLNDVTRRFGPGAIFYLFLFRDYFMFLVYIPYNINYYNKITKNMENKVKYIYVEHESVMLLEL